MAQTEQDDGFHEIQLNGKQLVFLFMAATVVSVVIFLCGVLVGRGVRAERGGAAESSAANDATAADITPTQPPVAAAPVTATGDPAAAPPTPQAEDLSYFKRLEDPKPQQGDLKPAASKNAAPPAAPQHAQSSQSPAQPAVAAAAPAGKNTAPVKAPPAAKGNGPAPAATTASKDAAATSDPQPQPPAGQGYAVQIAALNVRSEADAIAKHLTSKGYQAYVASNGTPAIYRVRVGTFKTRREAETVAAKLQKEEQLKPWVTR